MIRAAFFGLATVYRNLRTQKREKGTTGLQRCLCKVAFRAPARSRAITTLAASSRTRNIFWSRATVPGWGVMDFSMSLVAEF